jgi:hypothetical protein
MLFCLRSQLLIVTKRPTQAQTEESEDLRCLVQEASNNTTRAVVLGNELRADLTVMRGFLENLTDVAVYIAEVGETERKTLEGKLARLTSIIVGLDTKINDLHAKFDVSSALYIHMLFVC